MKIWVWSVTTGHLPIPCPPWRNGTNGDVRITLYIGYEIELMSHQKMKWNSEQIDTYGGLTDSTENGS